MIFSPACALLILSSAPVALSQKVEEPQARLPDGVVAIIQRAIASGDAKAIEIVANLARETHPSAAGQVDALLTEWRMRSAAAEAQTKQEQPAATDDGGLLADWKGQLELGASRSTGRTSYLGAVGSVSVERDGTRWRNKVNGRLEVQQGRNVTDAERVVASWQPNYKFDDDLYAYGLTQLESDTSQAYRHRYTVSGGLGYSVLKTPTAAVDLEGGPAFRRVHRAIDTARSSVAARASINVKWAITPTLQLKQASSFFLESGNRNATAVTSLDAQVLGPLKARLTYDVRYEDRISAGTEHLDTLSRATLVYSF